MWLLIILPLIFLLGKSLIVLLALNLYTYEKIGLSWLLGFGLLTLSLFLSNLIGVPFSLHGLIILLLILNLILWFSILKFRSKIWLELLFFRDILLFMRVLKRRWNKSDIATKFSYVFLLFLVFSSFVYTIYWPVTTWDALAVYDFRARSFFATGYMNDAISRGYFSHYPLLTSLSHLIVYLAGAKNPLFVYWLFYLALFCISFSYSLSLRGKYWTRYLSILIPFLLIETSVFYRHSGIAYTNFPYSLFLISSRLYLYRAFLVGAKQRRKILLLSSFLLALSVWTRANEPFFVSNFFMALIYFLLFERKNIFFSFILYLVPVITVYVSWFIFTKISFGSAGWVIGRGGEIMKSFIYQYHLFLRNTNEVLPYIYKHFVSVNSWGLIAFLAISLFLLFTSFSKNGGKKLWQNRRSFFLLDIIFNVGLWIDLLLMIVGVYIFSVKFEVWKEIGDSLTRMMMFFSPLAILHVVTVLRNFQKYLSGN